MKYILILCLAVGSLFAGSEVENESADESHFFGTVTAVNSNLNRPGVSFTAVDARGQVKMFYVSSLEYLDVNDRVELTCYPAYKFPLEVKRIRFLTPKK